jgi:nucleoside-diphosphate-sugar epimerase
MQTIFVTGATGFIGTALVRQLLNDGFRVRAMCRTSAKGAALGAMGAEIVQGDIQQSTNLRALIEGCDTVYHVAAALGGGSASLQYNVNVQGTRNVIKAAHEAGVDRFVHVSSIAVYGYRLSGDIDEDQPMRPPSRDFYMQTKAFGEQAAWKYAARTGLKMVSIRPAFVYGAGSSMWTQRMYDLSRLGLILINGGRGIAHPIHIDDVVDLLVTVGSHSAAVGNAFHAAPDPAPTWAEFLGYYAAMQGSNARKIQIQTPSKQILRPIANALSIAGRLTNNPFDVYGAINHINSRITYKMTRAKTLLDWQSKVSLSDGMARTESWLRSLVVKSG